MSLEDLFDFLKEPGEFTSGSIPPVKTAEDFLVTRIVPEEIVSTIVQKGPENKTFLDVFLAIKSIEVFRNLDEKIYKGNQDLPNTLKTYNLQKELELERSYQLLTRHSVSVFSEMVNRSSYGKSVKYVAGILEYLISFYLILEKYEECAEIKKYIDFLLKKS